MANIELVIRIDEETYNEVRCRGLSLCPRDVGNLVKAIRSGKPLPEGHGRLIDADEFEELFEEECVGDCGACMPKRKTDGRGRWYDTCLLIDTATTIVEADKA